MLTFETFNCETKYIQCCSLKKHIFILSTLSRHHHNEIILKLQGNFNGCDCGNTNTNSIEQLSIINYIYWALTKNLKEALFYASSELFAESKPQTRLEVRLTGLRKNFLVDKVFKNYCCHPSAWGVF